MDTEKPFLPQNLICLFYCVCASMLYVLAAVIKIEGWRVFYAPMLLIARLSQGIFYLPVPLAIAFVVAASVRVCTKGRHRIFGGVFALTYTLLLIIEYRTPS